MALCILHNQIVRGVPCPSWGWWVRLVWLWGAVCRTNSRPSWRRSARGTGSGCPLWGCPRGLGAPLSQNAHRKPKKGGFSGSGGSGGEICPERVRTGKRGFFGVWRGVGVFPCVWVNRSHGMPLQRRKMPFLRTLGVKRYKYTF